MKVKLIGPVWNSLGLDDPTDVDRMLLVRSLFYLGYSHIHAKTVVDQANVVPDVADDYIIQALTLGMTDEDEVTRI